MANKPIGVKDSSRRSIDAKTVDGFLTEEPDRRDFNQAIYQSSVDHIWGTEDQVKSSGTANMYTDGAGATFDLNDVAKVINKDDKILIAHDVTQLANLLLDCGGAKVTLEMYGGVTLDMDTFDLTLGVTAGDKFTGDIRVTSNSSAEILTILESDNFKVDATNMTVLNQAGFVVVNNAVSGVTESIDWKAVNLVLSGLTNDTIDVDADSIELINPENIVKIIEPLNLTIDITVSGANGIDTGSQSVSTLYYIWAIGKQDGTQAGLFSLSNTSPTMPSGYTFKANIGNVFNDVSGNLSNPRLEKTAVLQVVTGEIGRGTVSSVVWPDDDTVPQISEGSAAYSFLPFIPKSASSKILIEFNIFLGETTNVINMAGVALHADNQTDALRVQTDNTQGQGSLQGSPMFLAHVLDSWGLIDRVFSIRISAVQSFNYQASAGGTPSARYSAVASSSLYKITEYRA